MAHNISPRMLRSRVLEALAANYRGWKLAVCCGRCDRAVAFVAVEDALAADPAATVAAVIARLRCRGGTGWRAAPCRGRAAYVRLDAPDGTQIVLVGRCPD